MVLGGDDLRAGREVKLGPAGTGEPYAVAGADLLVSRLVHRDQLADAAGGGAAPGSLWWPGPGSAGRRRRLAVRVPGKRGACR